MAEARYQRQGTDMMAYTLLAMLLALSFAGVQAQLDPNYYAQSCPNVETIARNAFLNRVNFFNILALPANILRLAFHDCAVDGCEASVMLSSSPDGSISDEKLSGKNVGIGNLQVIEYMKQQLDQQCGAPVVSCADTIALAGREAFSFAKGLANLGAQTIPIGLGRRDGLSAQTSHADAQLPPADISVDSLISFFGNMGLNIEQSVALLGSHTIGISHCVNIVNRLYPSLDETLNRPVDFLFAQRLKLSCPQGSFSSGTVINNDPTNTFFDNVYFNNVLNGRGLLTADDNLRKDPRTMPYIMNFATNQQYFFTVFAEAYSILTSFNVLTGSAGTIRTDCTQVN